MKVTLYMATSIDGYIAKLDKDSEWVSEACATSFMKTINEYGCIIVGSHTFDQYTPDLYPIKDTINIVLSSDKTRGSSDKNVFFVTDANSALVIAEAQNCQQALLIGGGHTNSTFLKENLIDEIILDVHPLILGKGIKLFEDIEKLVNLERLSTISMDDGLVQIRYKVIK